MTLTIEGGLVALLGDDAAQGWETLVDHVAIERERIDRKPFEEIEQWSEVDAVLCTAKTAQQSYVEEELPAEVPLVAVDVASEVIQFRDPHSLSTTDTVDLTTVQGGLEGLLGGSTSGSESSRVLDTRDPRRSPSDELEDISRTTFREQVMMHAGEPLVIADAETGIIVEANEAATELFCRPRGSLIGSEQWELHPFEERDEYRKAFSAAVQDGYETVHSKPGDEIWIERPGGERVPVDITGKTITLDGRTYIVGVFRDAKERVERLWTIEQQAKAMDTSLTGISILDSEGVYTYMNEAHAAILGYESPKDLLGKTWRAVYDEERIKYIEQQVFPELRDRGVWEGNLVGQQPDGSAIPQQVHLTELSDGGLICVNRDRSDEHQRESRLQAIRERVETFVTAADTEVVIDELLRAVKDIVDQPIAGYWKHDAEANQLVQACVSDAADELSLPSPTFGPDDSSLAWQAFQAGEMRYYPNLANETDTHVPEPALQSEVIVPVGSHGVLLVGSPVADDFSATEREILGILAMHTETALQLLANRQALEESQAQVDAERRQLRDIIDQVPHLIFVKDPDGRFVLANEATAEAYGTTVDDLEGRTDADFAASKEEVEAFRADDQTVLSENKSLHRSEERLTDAEGSERVLDTLKTPFEPADDDADRAVLGVATDITEHKQTELALRREQQLNSLSRVGELYTRSASPQEMARTGTEAIVEALNAAAAQTYLFDPESAQLERAASAGELPDAATDRDTISPGEHFAWQAFSQYEAASSDSDVDLEIDSEDCDGFTRVVTRLSAHGVLVIYRPTDVESDSTFIRTAARNLTATLDRAVGEERLEQLNDRLCEQNDRLERKTSIAEEFRQAHERLITASSPDTVFDILVEFGASQGTNAWIGAWDARRKRLTPITEAVDGGPATEHGDTVADAPDASPLFTAVRQGTPTKISDVRTQTDYEAWSQRLLRFGYQSSVALPISRNGLPFAALEIVSADSGGIPDDVVDYAVTLCNCAGLLLEQLSQRSSSSMSIIDIDFPEEQFFFERADTEMRIDSEEVHFVGDKILLDGEAEAADEDALRSYLADRPGIADIDVTPKGEDYLFGLKIADGPTTPVVEFKEQLDRCNATLRAVSTDAETETVTVQVPTQSVTDLLEGLDDTIGTCTLRTKRSTDQTAESASQRALLSELTERQVEIISAAYQLGYYEQPKSTTGEELAEQFDLSASTVHQHLRSGARKIISQLFETPDH